MENIHEILKEYGLEVPADKKADFDKAWKENYRTKSEYDNAVSQRDKRDTCRFNIIHDELLGTDTYVDIVTVDKFAVDSKGNAPARKRTYSVVADSEGDGTDALIYSGNFKAVSEITEGYATTADEWQTITFTAGSMPV